MLVLSHSHVAAVFANTMFTTKTRFWHFRLHHQV